MGKGGSGYRENSQADFAVISPRGDTRLEKFRIKRREASRQKLELESMGFVDGQDAKGEESFSFILSHKPAHVSIWLKILLCLPIALGTKSTFLLVSYHVASWELQLLLFTSPPSTSPRLHSYSLDPPPAPCTPAFSGELIL